MEKTEWIKTVMALGSDRFNADITYHVMIDLHKRKGIEEVSHHFSDELRRLYLKAREVNKTDFNIYLPISAREQLKFSILDKYVSSLSEKDKSITLAFLTRDMQCIFYNLSSGLPP